MTFFLTNTLVCVILKKVFLSILIYFIYANEYKSLYTRKKLYEKNCIYTFTLTFSVNNHIHSLLNVIFNLR